MPTNDERNRMENNANKPKDRVARRDPERNEEQDAIDALKQHIDGKGCL